MNALRFPTLLVAAAALIACSAPADEPPPAGTPPTDEPPVDEPPVEEASFELTLSVDKLPVLQGSSGTLDVSVTRKNGFTGAVTIAEAGLPEGAGLEPVTIAADEDSATLEVKADASAPHSLPTSVTIKGTSGELEAEKKLTVTVYGRPGSLDTSFAGGKVTVPMSQSDDYAYAMAVQADGKILVAGRSADHLGDFAVLRLERDGDLDPTFGQGGKVVTEIGEGADTAYAIAVQPDGKIVVAGSTTTESSGLDFAVLRLLPEGAIDGDFGDAGKVVTSFTADSDTAYAILLQPDGKIVVGGDSNQGSSATGVDFALLRLEEDGSLDEGFGEGGKVITSLAQFGGRDSIYALALHAVGGEDRIVAAGGEGDFTVARYLPDGELDTTFGSEGKLTGLLGSSIGAARAVQIDAENRVLVAGHHTNDFALVRLSERGEPDSTFGDAGTVVTALSQDNWDQAQGLAVDPDGKIVLGGWVYEGNSSAGNFALVRYDDDGALDDAFGEGGIVITEVAAPAKRDDASAILLQSDERVPTVRVLLAGSASDTNSDFAVTRYWR